MRYPRLLRSLLVVVAPFMVAACGEPEAPPPGWFADLDRDGSGHLDAEEGGGVVAAADLDGDGTSSVAEAVAYDARRRRVAETAANRPTRTQMLFRARDLDAIGKRGPGLWVVSIGHSCVIPAIDPCIRVARAAGHPNHTHLMQFFGGAQGAPRAQWTHAEELQQAKPALATGKIDVLTFGHLFTAKGKSVGCDVVDYDRWMRLATKHNPKITFYVQDLWPYLPGPGRDVAPEEFDLATYEAAMTASSRAVDEVVAALDDRYPGRVHVLPVGPAVTELVRRFTRGELPGVDAILVPPKDSAEGRRIGLYRDRIHATDVIAALQGYVYYACLYRASPVDLDITIHRDPVLDRTLREVAWKTVNEHPRSGVSTD